MVNALIIDDQDYKIEDISSLFDKKKILLDSVKTFFDAKKFLLKKSYDFILLDMAISDQRSSYMLGGIDILTYMRSFNIQIPVIIITQYYDFSRPLDEIKNNSNFSEKNLNFNSNVEIEPQVKYDMSDLMGIHKFLSNTFYWYYGCILYDQNNNDWKFNLKEMLLELGGEKYEGIIIG